MARGLGSFLGEDDTKAAKSRDGSRTSRRGRVYQQGLALDLTPLDRAEAVGELAALPGLDHAPGQVTHGEALHGHRDRPLSRLRLPLPWVPPVASPILRHRLPASRLVLFMSASSPAARLMQSRW